MKVCIKLPDIIIICAAVCLVLFLAYSAYLKPVGTPVVLIRGQGREWLFPLDAQETVVVSGTLGNTVVKIQDGGAWVESSPCVNQNCTASGLITRQGQWTACLPNNVLVLIQGNDSGGIDAAAW